MDTVKLCAVAILVTVISVTVQKWNSQFELPLKLSSAVLFIGLVLSLAVPLVSYVTGMMKETAASSYATVVMRALGVAVLSETVSGICRECKEPSVASYIEMAGRLEILILCLPLMEEILESVKGLLSL